MREILFRQWDGKRFHYWGIINGNFISPLTGYCRMSEHQQYTGLKDKNGKEIFEGDILKLTDTNSKLSWAAIVEFGNPNCKYDWGFQLKPINKFDFNTDTLLWIEIDEGGTYCEVIGNIYENPLEGESK